MHNKRRIAALIAVCGLIGAVGTGAALAYFTDEETHTNTFTVGKVEVDGLEEHWDTTDKNRNGIPDKSEHTVPNQEIPKDPQIKNTGINDAIVFIKLTVPVRNVTLVSDDGTKSVKKPQEVFWFKDANDTVSTHANNFDPNWIHLSKEDTGTDLSGSARTYVFGYNAKIAKDQVTTPLFGEIQVKNIIEGEIAEGEAQNIVVDYYAIQPTEILENSNDLTDKLDETNLSKIYDVRIRFEHPVHLLKPIPAATWTCTGTHTEGRNGSKYVLSFFCPRIFEPFSR